MKWIKVPIEDEVYEGIRYIAEASGFSPEELGARVLSGAFKQVTEMVAQGRFAELEAFSSNPAAAEMLNRMFDRPLPLPGELWTP